MSERLERRARGELSRVLVVDDEADIRELVDLTLSRMGLAADCAGSVQEAVAALESGTPYQLCLTDMRLPDGEGLEIVRLIGERFPQIPVAVITAYGSTENAVAALKAGAFDYLAKPIGLEALRSLVRTVLDVPRPQGGVQRRLTGESVAVAQVRALIEKLAASQAPVYVSGESGSGKELAARTIHDLSRRASGPFVPVNCGAIPESLVESEFFGYRKGAFTGADADRDGFFQAANGGTLFLDEVADLPLTMQVKLLRALQEKRVRKVGSATEEAVDVRVISATHRDLAACVEQGSFRQDLYYRLNVIEVRMPALRERREDIPELVSALLERIGGSGGGPRISPEALDALSRYDFPGNVRELENILERASALCADGLVRPDDLQLRNAIPAGTDAAASGDLQGQLDSLERQIILEALLATGRNRTAAARRLGVTFRSLRYRIERLGIDVGDA
jgi:two-component system response regulator PilR (NtrC family)